MIFFRIYIAFFFVMATLVLPSASVFAEGNNYYKTDIKQQKIDKNQWKKTIKGLEYKESEYESQKPFNMPKFNVNKKLIKVIFYVIIFASLVFLFIKLFPGMSRWASNRKTQEVLGGINYFNPQDNILMSDLDNMLQKAISKQEYREAVRVYFLQTLKALNNSNYIQWDIHKTNRDYLIEMYNKEGFEEFQYLTALYELAWYGEAKVHEDNFNSLSIMFKDFINSKN